MRTTVVFLFISMMIFPFGESRFAWAGPDQAKLDSYFDSLLKQSPDDFEAWYPKKKDKFENPRSLSFDASRALNGHWSANVASAAVASFQTRKTFAAFIQTLADPTLILAWLRNTPAVTSSDVIERNLDAPKIRMTLSMPALDEINGFYSFHHFLVSDRRLVLRISQLSDEGPAQDHEMMILIDRNADQTAFVHIVDVIILKPARANTWLSKFWFNWRLRKDLVDLIQGLSKTDKDNKID